MGILRTAVRASVATRVAGNVHRKQQNRWAAEDAAKAAQAQAPFAPVAAAVVAEAGAGQGIEQLKQLGELRAAGILTDAEFESQKQRILASM